MSVQRSQKERGTFYRAGRWAATYIEREGIGLTENKFAYGMSRVIVTRNLSYFELVAFTATN